MRLGATWGAGGAIHAWVAVSQASGATQSVLAHGPVTCTPVTKGHTSITTRGRGVLAWADAITGAKNSTEAKNTFFMTFTTN